MKLTSQQIELIKKYVSEEFFDVSKLFSYLERQDTVGEEIYSHIKIFDEMDRSLRLKTFGFFDFDGYYFKPIDIPTFIKRLPFYFYITEDDVNYRYSLSDMLMD
ncbi:MAG: hypothetical protein LBH24_00595 [Clostridiales bacterium]|jgi:hypothetical protein|nr:hypothetical protein [Clostridiales bacterium]